MSLVHHHSHHHHHKPMANRRPPGRESHNHHDPAGHFHHGDRPKSSRAMMWALVLTAAFAVVEAATGWWSGSLALISDAGHMVSDALSLGLGTFAIWVGKRPPTQRHSYGLQRAEVIAALLNGLLLLAVISAIVIEALLRIHEPTAVSGVPVIVVAFLGMLLNAINGWMLSRMEQGLNTRAAMIHVMGDFLGSVAALLAGVIVWWTGWMPIDPILSLVVAALMLYSTVRILTESIHVLMEGVPDTVSLQEVGEKLAAVEGVHSVHDLHIWTLTSGLLALSAHLELDSLECWPGVLQSIQYMLSEEHGIEHVTLQPEVRPAA
ncbi:MAG: cation transporter [Betaproteobacteria bacterium]|nr:cation transporter [Betaproteobacteria bacterium]